MDNDKWTSNAYGQGELANLTLLSDIHVWQVKVLTGHVLRMSTYVLSGSPEIISELVQSI